MGPRLAHQSRFGRSPCLLGEPPARAQQDQPRAVMILNCLTPPWTAISVALRETHPALAALPHSACVPCPGPHAPTGAVAPKAALCAAHTKGAAQQVCYLLNAYAPGSVAAMPPSGCADAPTHTPVPPVRPPACALLPGPAPLPPLGLAPLPLLCHLDPSHCPAPLSLQPALAVHAQLVQSRARGCCCRPLCQRVRAGPKGKLKRGRSSDTCWLYLSSYKGTGA